MTGTTIAQAIPIAISPILTRIYTPEDFGVLALFVAITSIFGSITNGRYELAIMLPKKDEDAINILALGFIINVFVSLCLLIIIFIFHCKIVNLLNNQEISPWLYLVPISVFLMGCFNLLNYYNNRKKYYKDLAKANIFKSVGMVIVQLLIGFLKAGAIGLISGQIFAQIISNTKLFLNIKKDNLFIKIKKVKIIALAKRYKDFPKFSIWSGFLNTASLQVPFVILNYFFTLNIVGFYSLAYKTISMPMSFIGSSIGQVFFQETSKAKHNKEKLQNIVFNTYLKLLKIGIIPFSILTFFGDYIFAFVFGKEWIIAGIYVQYLSIWILFVFITSPLTTLFATLEKQKLGLYFNIVLLASRVLVLVYGGYILKNSDTTILIYGVIGALFWAFWSFYLMSMVGISFKKSLLTTLKYILLFFAIFGGIRILV
jgi:O-antigen/teichoic acid export membrane protein